MAKDFIKIVRTDASATHAAVLLEYVRSLRSAYDQGMKIKAIMDHNQDGVDFSAIEGLFGLPAGTGNAVYDLVNGSVGSMSGTFQTDDAKEITEKVG